MASSGIIAVDAMGGDNAPAEIVKGVVDAVNRFGVSVLLVGDENRVRAELSSCTFDQAKITVVHASQTIGFDEPPASAIKEKKDSSIMVGLRLLKEGKAGAFVSAGSTGALLAGATITVGRLRGVERPALGALLPNTKSHTLLLDSGANVDCKPTYLAQFAKMGAVYMEAVQGVKSPKVGLVNIGAEREKGNALVKEAYPLLEAAGLSHGVNFVGNVEPRDIPLGAVDVAVCDGFVGNVILKYSEGFAKGLLSMIKRALMAGFLSKLGAVLSAGAFKGLKKTFDPSEVGGAPFLGLKALVVKAHGGSDARAITNAVRQCKAFIDGEVAEKMAAIFSANAANAEGEGGENG